MAEQIVTLSSDEAQLLKAMQRVLESQNKTDSAWKKNQDSSQKFSDSAVKDAERIERENKRAADAIYREHKKLLDQKELESRKAAQNEAAIARQTAIAEAKEAANAADREIKEAEKILKAKQQLAKSEMATIDGPLASLGKTVSVASAIAAAVGTATKAWDLYSEAQDKALGSLESLDASNRKLAQVANSPEDLAALQTRADKGALATGVSRQKAREVLFNARSEGYEASFEAILASSTVVDPTPAADVAGKLPALFKGKIGRLESISLALLGAKESNMNFEQMAGSLSTAAEGGTVIGSTPEETTAIMSVLSARFKSPDTAADRTKGFGVRAGIDPRFAGAGFIGAFERLATLPETERKDFLGDSQELNTFYSVMKEELPKVKEQLEKARSERKNFAAGGGMLRDQIKIADGDRNINAMKKVQISRIEAEIATEKNLFESATNKEESAKKTTALVESKNATLINRFSSNVASTGINLATNGMKLSPEFKAGLASGMGDFVDSQFKLMSPALFGGNEKGRVASIVAPKQVEAPFDPKKAIEDSFKADPGQGPGDTKATNAGLIAAIESERQKLGPKISELQGKQAITDLEQVQIRKAELNVEKTKALASSLGTRDDLAAQNIRVNFDGAKANLENVRQSATLTAPEAKELASLQSKDAQYAARIEELRRQDADNLLKETQKTNAILSDLSDKLVPTTDTPSPNAIRAQNDRAKE
jgi:hypothetical protein